MPKFLALASYTSEGIKGLTKAGGTARRAVADKMLKNLGGRLEAFYFAFGENAAYVIFDVPDNSTAAANGAKIRRYWAGLPDRFHCLLPSTPPSFS